MVNVSGQDATEVMPLHPKSYYGAGKAAAEHFISAWSHQFRRAAIIIRPSNMYTARGRLHEKDLALSRLLLKESDKNNR